ncbi:hypothetical protein [Silvanigrella aquatica]|uniref:Uncharacterized protein n=1 Tax=Silvanigrella aquatica TaxID=1915309 RepID=A0A1L4D3S0_9BACT|nr:hypothetical protein [Silvanigrella aquatica]APJ04822.1 hypothetical protein AXG55_13305 [Silvanigrella aquatica]
MKFLKKFIIINLALFCNNSFGQSTYQISVPESNEYVSFSIERNNYISFISFPKNLKGNLNIINTSSINFYPGGVNNSNCSSIENKAKNAMNYSFPETIRSTQRDLVRKFGTTILNVNSGVYYNINAFRKRVLDKAAEIMHTDISKFDLDNSFQIEKVTYEIEYNKNAITNIIDNKEELKPQTDKLINQILFNTGSENIELYANDLICDLYSGNAKLKMKFSGSFGKQNIISYLLQKNEIGFVYQNMLNHYNEYYENSLNNSKNKNLILSSLFLKYSLEKILKRDIDDKNFINIFEQIINQETGKLILNLDSETLYKKMEIHDNKPYYYTSDVIFDYKSRSLKVVSYE